MQRVFSSQAVINQRLSRILGVVFFIALTSLGAFVRIPLLFTPVPLTLQTFFVLLSGALLGSKLGFTSQAVYLLLGLSGLPLFTGGFAGALYFAGPTAGYLAGFLFAALISGKLIKKDDCWGKVFAKFMLADAVLLASGMLWLKLSLGLSLTNALFLGVIPFVIGDLLKIAAATSVYKSPCFR